MKSIIIISIILVIITIIGILMIIPTPIEKTVSNDLENKISTTPIQEKQESITTTTPSNEGIMSTSQNCLGHAQCIVGTVSEIIDGNTIIVNEESIRFALASAPGLNGYGGSESKRFIETICPMGSTVLVDEDDGQILGSYGRIIGMIHCNGVILNSELLDANLGFMEIRFCDSSEFRNSKWAEKHGC